MVETAIASAAFSPLSINNHPLANWAYPTRKVNSRHHDGRKRQRQSMRAKATNGVALFRESRLFQASARLERPRACSTRVASRTPCRRPSGQTPRCVIQLRQQHEQGCHQPPGATTFPKAAQQPAAVREAEARKRSLSQPHRRDERRAAGHDQTVPTTGREQRDCSGFSHTFTNASEKRPPATGEPHRRPLSASSSQTRHPVSESAQRAMSAKPIW